MKIEVLFFASIRDLAGRDQETVEVAEGASVEDLVQTLTLRYPALTPALGSLRFAVNEDFVDTSQTLSAGDQLAFLPPVSGG